jgi:hypothetical protein
MVFYIKKNEYGVDSRFLVLGRRYSTSIAFIFFHIFLTFIHNYIVVGLWELFTLMGLGP